MVLAPLVTGRKGEHQGIFRDLRRAGFVRVRVDGEIHDLSEEFQLDKNKKHAIEVVVDRLQIGDGDDPTRLTDSIETALKLGSGIVLVSVQNGEEMLFSEHFACAYCGISLGKIEPRTFSFNNPHGACPTCSGLGFKMEIDPDLVLPDRDLSIKGGAIHPWARNGSMSVWYSSILESLSQRYGFSLYTPVREIEEPMLNLILYGCEEEMIPVTYRGSHGKLRHYHTRFEGVIPMMERRYRETDSEAARAYIGRYMSFRPCPTCQGRRLKPESLAVTIEGKNIMDIAALPVKMALEWAEELGDHIEPRELAIAHQVIKEIRARLGFLQGIGLGYLTLDRPTASLSGGESQRIHLATQIGSGLSGVLYICDEPTIGLHPADSSRLIVTLQRLRDLGNTVIVVEHDEATMKAADYIVDMGPGAGKMGGDIVAAGSLPDIMNCPDSITGQYLSGGKTIPVPQQRRSGSGKELLINGARENNLKNIYVSIPLGRLVCVTGVSGSGKSSLINEILYKHLARSFYHAVDNPGICDNITGTEYLDKVINIDQSPIGRTPRSNPATYTGLFTLVRQLFAEVPESRARGYQLGRFSFNVKGGRCEACQGAGYVQIEMQFLPSVTVPCEICQGSRYNREALEIRFKGKNIAEVLDMTVDEALSFFDHFPGIKRKLGTLRDVGLGYICLGQPAPTLSGGEAQRVKLASELSRKFTGNTLYILDEPTTGLSFPDISSLLKVLHRLVDAGNTVIVIEHHLDVVKNADWIIDLGPAAGDEGGYIIATGTPEDIVQEESSVTGSYLKRVLAK